MKQKFLSIISLVMITAVAANAQIATNYRGAFAPAPIAQWTDNWTNWDPQNTFYPAPTEDVIGTITTSQTWTRDKVYLLKGLVYVDTLVTLTIEAGTVILGDANTVISSLVISRGGKLIANGTPCNPIVFTSSRARGARVRGDWGGITLLGRARNNRSANAPIEGIVDNGSGKALHGGTDDADNSGSLKYVRIEYAGYTLLPNQELNSLTLGSVGSATTVDYVQTSFGNDDAFEWFGGTVNCAHLVAYKTLDDDLDVDLGYSGTVQFALTIKDPTASDASTSEGWEADGNPDPAPYTLLPRTTARFFNVTQIGGFRCAGNAGPVVQPTSGLFNRGARLRRGTQIQIVNSILMNNFRGLEMTTEVLSEAVAVFQNNVLAMDTVTTFVTPYAGLARFASTTATDTYLRAAANRNNVLGNPCDVLVRAWDELNPDFRPNAIGSGAALAGADLTPSVAIERASFAPSQEVDLAVDVFETGAGNSNGTFTVTMTVPSTFTVTVPGITLTTTNQSGVNGTLSVLGTAYFNSNFDFRRNAAGTSITITSKVGVNIAQGSSTSLGFRIQRKATTPVGTNASLAVAINGGSDNNASNNSARQGLSTTL